MKKNYAFFAAAMLASAACASASASNVIGSNVTLFGTLIYDQATPGVTPTGIYSTKVKPSAAVTKVGAQVTKANGGACLADTAYFAVEYTTKYGNVDECYLNSYNPETWQLTNKVAASHSSIATSLTYILPTKRYMAVSIVRTVRNFILALSTPRLPIATR